MAPGSTTAISTKVPASASAPAFSHRVSVADATIYGCSGANNVRCLTSDPLVASAVWSLRTSDDGKSLLQGASDFGVRIVRRQFPEGVLGSYSHSTRIIALDQRLDASSIWVRGTVLAHELQHAVDDAGGKWPTTSAQCYQAEEAAFKRQAYIWNGMWQNYLPANVDRLHAELNQVTLAVFRDPVGFLRALTSLYERQCGVN
jgi:hypothetical protein